MRLKDKVCIITGAGSGIGRATSLLFAREGAKVVVADVSAKGGAETVDLVKKAGGDAAFVEVDVSKAAEVERMARFAVGAYKEVNVLFNNAGIAMQREDHMITELKEEVWDKIIDTNLKGVYLCCKYVIPELLRCGGGSIINTASTSGVVGYEAPSYCASKGGVIALTRAIAREYGSKNIRVNAICPGTTDTPLAAGTRAVRDEIPLEFPWQETLVRRTGKPEEIAYMALYLASNESAYVTGAAFLIDGGWTAV